LGGGEGSDFGDGSKVRAADFGEGDDSDVASANGVLEEHALGFWRVREVSGRDGGAPGLAVSTDIELISAEAAVRLALPGQVLEGDDRHGGSQIDLKLVRVLGLFLRVLGVPERAGIAVDGVNGVPFTRLEAVGEGDFPVFTIEFDDRNDSVELGGGGGAGQAGLL